MKPILVHDHDTIDVSEAVFSTDEKTGKMTARVTIIKSGRAKGKPRNYTSAAIRKAAKEGIYDGMRMYVNHSDKPPTKRSFGEMVSAVESTEYDPKKDSVVGNVEFFDKEFFEKAQLAQKYMGVSADHRIRVNYVQEGRDRIEEVQAVELARSVDWVVYPAAGGEIISFAKESEGADQVEWDDITLEDLKKNSPKILEAFKSEIVKEAEEAADDDDDTKDKLPVKKEKDAKEAIVMTPEAIQKLVQEQVTSITTASDEKARKQRDASKAITEVVSKAGLPPRTQLRVIESFSDALEYVEADVKEAIDEAKAELKEAKAGPRIVGMGSTSANAKEGEQEETHSITVKESVESIFGIGKEKKVDPKKATTGASGKES